MKGKAGIFVVVLVLLAASFFLERQSSKSSQPEEETTTGVITVTGKVTNKENGNAIVGVRIIVQASSTITETDDNGEYSISAKIGDILVASRPGYRRTSVEVTENIQDIQLTPKE